MMELSYTSLDKRLYAYSTPRQLKNPEMVIYNDKLGTALGLDYLRDKPLERTAIFSGQQLFARMQPIAQAYGGHQFGYFSVLGDGRAHLIGEIKTPSGQLFDCMLKGSGQTPYSRRGDGLAALGPMLREYVFSEAMAGLLIPTSRSLAVVATNETVYREKPLAGAILTRIASSHIRAGTFQFANSLQDRDALKSLADYAIQRHYSDEVDGTQASKYLMFFQEVSRRQARLIAEWLSVGFIHGVMNTDNMLISGETMDYGPCAFMNTYNPLTVFSSIDVQGRYAYGNQPHIAAWNLARLAEALLPIIDEDQTKAIEAVNRVLSEFEQAYWAAYLEKMAAKLGLGEVQAGDDEMINDLLRWMEQYQADYTQTFIRLTLRDVEALPFAALPEFTSWYEKITVRQRKAYENSMAVEKAMKLANPAFIPRNQLVESALIRATEKASMTEFHNLLELIQDPFAYTKEQLSFAPPPPEFDQNYKTYCGT